MELEFVLKLFDEAVVLKAEGEVAVRLGPDEVVVDLEGKLYIIKITEVS